MFSYYNESNRKGDRKAFLPSHWRIIHRLCVCICLLSSVCSDLTIERNFNLKRDTNFKIVWNIQTAICDGLGVDFIPLLKKYGITFNEDDKFRGNEINLLYDPGLFPIVKKDKDGAMIEVNGGIPQKGNLSQHLEKLKQDIEGFVAKDFKGLAVIDFEVWRPVFRQNWNNQVVYRNLSFDLVQSRGTYSTKEMQQLAKGEFEEAAQKFMLESLNTAKKMRPNALWGYYGYPYCYNFRGTNMSPECPDLAVQENNGTLWLFTESGALYPSLYLSNKRNTKQNILFMIGAFNEAFRVTSMVGFKPIFPYISPFYLEGDFLSEEEMFYSIEVPAYYQAGGVIFWAKSSQVNTKDKCQKLHGYVDTVLGPRLQSIKNARYIIDRCFEIPFKYKDNVANDHWTRLYNAFASK